MRYLSLLLCFVAGMAGCSAPAPLPEPATAAPSAAIPTATLPSPTQTLTSTAVPTATPTSTQAADLPTATPDIAKTIVATVQPRTLGVFPSPDQKWEARVLVYDCARIAGEEDNAYDLLKLVHLGDGVEKVVDSQLQYCGGLGAAGLAGLFWSSNSSYFYYTTAREGVPDGCGYWERPITRLDVTDLNPVYVGEGDISPDGKKIAAWQDRDLTIWDVDGDEVGRVAAAAVTAEIGPIPWSPDGQSLVYSQIESYCPFSGKSYIIRVDLPKLTSTVFIESDKPSLGSPVWNKPDELRLHDENGKEWLYTFSTKELKETVK